MRNNRRPKDELLEYESYLYGDYGVEEVIDILEYYLNDEDEGFDEFVDEYYPYLPNDFSIEDMYRMYDDFKSVRGAEYYTEDGETYLELSDRHVLWEINADIDNYTYWDIADKAIDAFEQEYDVSDVGYAGRSGRHVVCPATWENLVRYDELVAGMKECQQDFIDYINSNYGEYEE